MHKTSQDMRTQDVQDARDIPQCWGVEFYSTMLQFFLFFIHHNRYFSLFTICFHFLASRNFKIKKYIYASLCPLNHFKLTFQTNVMQFLKTMHAFFLLLGARSCNDYNCVISDLQDLKFLLVVYL